jgi:hypothetical protein
MAGYNTYSDGRNLPFPFPASVAININDFLTWSASLKQAVNITSLTTGASEAADQATVAGAFLGCSADMRLSTEADNNAARSVQVAGVFDFDCVSYTPQLGDLVGVTWNGGAALVQQVVKQVSSMALAIGRVIKIPNQANSATPWTSAVTRVTIQLLNSVAGSGSPGIGGVGYAVGSGGVVTQITSKATTVVLNKITGQITTHAANLATLTTVTFILTNSTIAATDVVVFGVVSGETTPGSYIVTASEAAAGSCKVNIFNVTGGGLAETLVIQFAVIKGAKA